MHMVRGVDVGVGRDGRPPVVLVGADTANGLSVARSLGRRGIRVYLLCRRGAHPSYSRFARRLDVEGNVEDWGRFLLDGRSDWLRGAILLSCSDDGVQLLLDHREALARKYVLDTCHPPAQWCFLNKLATYEAASEVGVPTPLFWRADSMDDLLARRDDYVYPLIVKPLFSHRFKKVFSGKYFVAKDFDELVTAFERVNRENVEVLLLEEIPGDDDRLCSCYTYIDEDDVSLLTFTKRVIRRYPEHQGFGSYHITDWNPEVLDLGERLVRHVGHKGLANVEFKRDDRDGQLKIIECNVRFTAANEILIASGYDLPFFIYSRLVGGPRVELRDKQYRRGVRLWFPLADFGAFVDLRKQGRLTTGSWLQSVWHRQTLPYFVWDDPLPSLSLSRRYLTNRVRRLGRRALQRALAPRGEKNPTEVGGPEGD